MSRLPIRILQVLLPFALVGGAGLAAYLMYLNRPPVEIQTPVIEPPGVRVQAVAFETLRLTVSSQGTVQPRTTSQLVPEISGPIIEVAESFAVGGFFEAGDVLLKIDPYDYQQAIIAARSQLAQVRLRLAQELAEAEVARREWAELGRGDASALTLRQPQVEDARAAVAAAEAALDRATRDLGRAEITAPYAGRVQSKSVDIGQFISRGNAVAQIYAIDSAEIRLPLPDEELAYVDIALSYRGAEQGAGPRVTVSANFAGRQHTWQGRIVRTESEIDPVSRMVHVVAAVDDPYSPGNNPSRPPLAAGMFVEAEIEGRTVRDVVVLPWAALRGGDRVLIVDESNRLRYRDVEILRSTSDAVLVRGGLAEGELVCISPLDAVTDGMAVRVLDGDTRMARATPATAPTPGPSSDTPALATPDAPAPESDTTQAAAVPAPPTGRFDIDPTLSREEQIAAIRRQLAALGSTPVAGAAPDTAPDRRTGAPPRVASAGDDRAQGGAPPTSARAPDRAAVSARAGRGGPGRSTGAAGPAGRGGRGGGRPRIRNDRGGRSDDAPATPRADPDPPAPAAPEPDTRAAAIALSTTPTVALVPFVNVSRNPADTEIGAGLTAALRTRLEATDGLNTVALTGADESTALETAEARNARWLVSGGYQRIDDQLRVTARVVEVATSDLVGTVKVDGTLGEIAALTREMVAAIGAELAVDGVDDGAAPRRATARDPIRRASPGRLAVAVLPFANVSRNPADAHLGSDMADAMTGGMQQLDGVSAVTLDAEEEVAALDAATARNATWLISGGYQHVGGQLRITARLLDVSTGELVQTVKVDGALDELPRLLAEVVATLRSALEARTSVVSLK